MTLRPGLCTALTQAVCDKLKSVAIRKVSDFITKDLEQLSQTVHIPYKDLCSIKRVLLAEHSAYPISAASLYNSALSSIATLSMGYESLDALLDGGVFTGEVTEIAGCSATGKSTICHRMAASAVRLDLISVIYIDTCCSFSPETILRHLVELTKEEPLRKEQLENSLSRIKCVETLDIYELFEVLDNISLQLSSKSQDNSDTLRLVVVDNVATVAMPIVGGGAVHSQGLLSQLGQALKQLAVDHSLAVLVTNNMVGSFNGSDKRAALGKVWSQMPHTRLIIECQDQLALTEPDTGQRMVKLVKSCRQKTPASALFSLNG